MDLLASINNVLDITLAPGLSRKIPKGCAEVWVWLENSHGKRSGKSNEELNRKLKKAGARDLKSVNLAGAASVEVPMRNGESIRVLRPALYEKELATEGHHNFFKRSGYGRARDAVGQWFRSHYKTNQAILLRFIGGSDEDRVGAMVGILLARYKYLSAVRGQFENLKCYFIDDDRILNEDLIERAEAMAAAINLSRHLGNTPGGDLNPKTYCEVVQHLFKRSTGKSALKNVKVQILAEKELKREKLNLIRGVGQGSLHGARLIHLSYHPKSKAKPVAFVGKGVTFDTGGLDLKPTSAMRLMKKDMAGSATVLGLCYLVSRLQLQVPCDFYLAIAENAVSERATRPGDVFETRDGRLVEIDNTDAEGRIVMADAILYALSKKSNSPDTLIDVSTLTGAMRVAVGLDIAGFFTNDDDLAAQLQNAARQGGESVWRLPLYEKYSTQLRSDFADFKNSADTGFGGAISAALFLEKFISNVRWGHFDMMGWNNSADGALSAGANAQTLQSLAYYLFDREQSL